MHHMTTSREQTSSFVQITNGGLGTLLGLVSEVQPKRLVSPKREKFSGLDESPHPSGRRCTQHKGAPALGSHTNERSHYLCCGPNE